MALEKIVEVDKVELVGDYSIQVRTATKVMDDGKQIGSTSYHRHVVHPSSNWENDKINSNNFIQEQLGVSRDGFVRILEESLAKSKDHSPHDPGDEND